MREFMTWEQCEAQWVKVVEPDPDKISSIIETAHLRLKDNERPVTKENVSFIVESYYEVIKELLTALLLSKGLKSRNHQCLISYFYNNYKEYEQEAHFILQLNFLRNRLNYYGELIEKSYYDNNKGEFVRVATLIEKLIKK